MLVKMYRSTQTYPVAQPNGKQANEPPKPCKPNEKLACSRGMFIGVLIGCVAVAILVYVWNVPNNLAPQEVNRYANMVPIQKQGNLAVYPASPSPTNDPSRNDSYLIILPPTDISKTVQEIQAFYDVYSKQQAITYTQCCVNIPTFNSPCSFEVAWLGDECTKDDNFGYSEKNGAFSPCVVLRFEKTGSWKPIPDKIQDLPSSAIEYYDPSFTQIYCHPKYPEDAKHIGNITVAPEKGFSSVYFPAINFSSEYYLPPAVVVKFNGIRNGTTVTVECAILAENTLTLDDEGMFNIQFTSS